MRIPKPQKITEEEKRQRKLHKWYALKDRARLKQIRKQISGYRTPKQKERDRKDKEHSDAVRIRDKWICQGCKKSFKNKKWQLHRHHVLGKSTKFLRWSVRFSISRCFWCHIQEAHGPEKKKIREKDLKRLEEIYNDKDKTAQNP